VNAFALPVTLMVMVKIKHSDPDSVAKMPSFCKRKMRVGFPSLSSFGFPCGTLPVEISISLGKE
ncbi:Hypothetical predicted protein, partial [Marmota monax]